MSQQGFPSSQSGAQEGSAATPFWWGGPWGTWSGWRGPWGWGGWGGWRPVWVAQGQDPGGIQQGGGLAGGGPGGPGGGGPGGPGGGGFPGAGGPGGGFSGGGPGPGGFAPQGGQGPAIQFDQPQAAIRWGPWGWGGGGWGRPWGWGPGWDPGWFAQGQDPRVIQQGGGMAGGGFAGGGPGLPGGGGGFAGGGPGPGGFAPQGGQGPAIQFDQPQAASRWGWGGWGPWGWSGWGGWGWNPGWFAQGQDPGVIQPGAGMAGGGFGGG